MTQRPALLPEIQGLRAVAVGLVLLFHLWPKAVPGGYVGVDVFFVISGFLITGLLARMALREGSISLLEFYSRRVRRLLPAATSVLMATAIGTILFIPQARWAETAQQISASAVYVQNWVLAWLSVDYLGAEQAPSPVQHYWSLSIEEQFYVVWPLLMIAAIGLARRFGVSMRRAFLVGLTLIFVLSLAVSVHITANEPAHAYFATHTRMWELALGGLLALTIHRLKLGMTARAGLMLLGVVAIAASALLFSVKTAFPGAAALLPTLGAALVILGGDIRLGAFRGLNVAALRYIGDRSYSIYLWHFPLITFFTVRHPDIGPISGLGLLVLTLVISHLSYRYIEERYRHPRARAELRPLIYGLVSVLACVVSAGAIVFAVSWYATPTIKLDEPRYPGPAALLAGAPVPDNVPLIPALANLKGDLPVVYAKKCHQDQASAEPVHCEFGDPQAVETVVILGDSHAAQWVPALRRIAASQGWRLVTFTKSTCAFARINVLLDGKPYPSCSAWRENAISAIKQLHPKIVFTSQTRYDVADSALIDGLVSVWREFTSQGADVVAIDDTPHMTFDPGDCLSETPDKCSVPRAEAFREGVLAAAATQVSGAKVVDMTDGICGPNACDAVVGNIIVWRDNHHLTATYAAALAPYLARRIGVALEGGDAVAKTGSEATQQGR
jgi:peptidoglycan/LPS O-acetylase OafA/YrhL